MTQTASDKRSVFAERMTAILNGGALNLAMAIGYRTRLFDVLDRFDTPQTASVIAREAGLDERYVREWLGVMVCGDVVELIDADGNDECYRLPKAHGDLLARRAGHGQLGVYTQEIPLLTTLALEPVVAAFATGDGVDYAHYPRFQAFMTQLADTKHQRMLIDGFLPSVDGGRMVNRLAHGIRVCDLGCGEGVATRLMAEAFPDSTFLGIDIAAEALATAEAAARQAGLGNLSFQTMDAATLPLASDMAASFDYVTAFDAIHDQTQPQAALSGVRAILRPGGAFSMIDIAAGSRLADNADHPMGPFLYTVSLMHCLPVGRVDGGAGLGMMWGRQRAVHMLRKAGFSEVQVTEIPDDPFNLHFFCTP